jgi:hypothetical protein
MGIDETTTKVHKKLAEVNSEAMIQLHKRSHKMHELIEGMERSVKVLREEAEENRKRITLLLDESAQSKARYIEAQEQRRRKWMAMISRFLVFH